MDTNLEIFVAVAEHRSFSKAAQLLHLTPPAVSLRIKNLEKKIGIALFYRTNKYVQLTKAGEIFYENSKMILKQYHHTYYLMEEYKTSPSGPLTVGAAYTFGEYFLPSILNTFCKLYPNIVPSVAIQNSDSIMNLIDRNELDIGIIVENENHDPKVDIKLFSKEEMVLVVPKNHAILNQSKLDANLLENETWILREKGSGTRHVAESLFSQLQIKPKRIMSFGSTQTIKGSVELGMGISYLSEFIVRKEVSLGLLKTVRLQRHPNKGEFYIVTNKANNSSTPTRLFSEFLKTYKPQNESKEQISLYLK